MIVDRDMQSGNFYSILGEVIKLMAVSDIHSKWTVSDIERLVAAPLFGERSLLYYNQDEGELISFVSFAFLNDEQEQHHINRTQKLHPSVFGNKPEDGNLWFIDFIAPFGGVPSLMRHTREWIAEIYPGVHEARYRRAKTGRVGRISAARPSVMH